MASSSNLPDPNSLLIDRQAKSAGSVMPAFATGFLCWPEPIRIRKPKLPSHSRRSSWTATHPASRSVKRRSTWVSEPATHEPFRLPMLKCQKRTSSERKETVSRWQWGEFGSRLDFSLIIHQWWMVFIEYWFVHFHFSSAFDLSRPIVACG